jgi:hypothetical protein
MLRRPHELSRDEERQEGKAGERGGVKKRVLKRGPENPRPGRVPLPPTPGVRKRAFSGSRRRTSENSVNAKFAGFTFYALE